MKLQKLYFDCECLTKLIRIMKFDDEEFIYFSIFNQGRNIFLSRIHHIWYILLHGTPYEDNIIFNKETATALANKLLEWANKEV